MTHRLRSHRLALVAAVLVLGAAACGTEDTAEPAAAVATTTAGPPVIRVAGGGAGGGRSAAPAVAESGADADVAAAADSKMMAAWMRFVFEGEAPDLTSPAASWSFAPGSGATAEQVAALAAALGVDGEPRRQDADLGGGWIVGPDDYSGPTLTVSGDAMSSWWFNPGPPEPSSFPQDCELYPPGDPTGDAEAASSPVCEPTPPVGVPTAAQAEARSAELFAAWGVDAASYELEPYADQWGAGVTGWLVLDGVRSNVSISAGFGAEGALTWASGFLATPERGADYPRIGVEAAVERLNAGSSGWVTGVAVDASGSAGSTGASAPPCVEFAGVELTPECDATAEEAPGTAAAEEPVVVTDGAATGGGETGEAPVAGETAAAPGEPGAVPGTDLVLVDPAVCDPAADCVPTDVDAEPITVVLRDPQPALEQLWSSDGTIWLVPAYSFTADDGGRYTATALPDEYLEIEEPVVGEDPVARPEPAVEPAVDPAVDPADTPAADQAVAAAELVGLDEVAAAEVAKGSGWELRVVERDGEALARTDDLRSDRVNVVVTDGVVTAVESVG